MQQNRIANWVLDTKIKNFVILAVFDKNLNIFFDKFRCDKKMLQNQKPCIGEFVY